MTGYNSFDGLVKSLYTALQYLCDAAEQLHNDKIYARIVNQKNSRIRYEDLEYLFLEVDVLKPKGVIGLFLKSDCSSKASEEYKYMQGIVANETMSIRDKLALLLCYLEPYIYKHLNIFRKHGIKKDLEVLVDKTNKIDSRDYKKLTVYGIVCVLFKDFKKTKIVIDRRIPHRNDILHNGTLDYNDKEIESAYYMLVLFIHIINVYITDTR